MLDGRRATGVELGRRRRRGAHRASAAGRRLRPASSTRPRSCCCPASGPARSWPSSASSSGIALDGVGRGYQDHAVVYITFQGTTDLREDFVIPKVRLIARSALEAPDPDLHIFMQPSIRMEGMPPLLPVSIRLLEHRPAARSAWPRPIRRSCRSWSPPCSSTRGRPGGDARRVPARPAAGRQTRASPRSTDRCCRPAEGDDPLEHILASYISYYHGVGTCRIGPADDPGAVVGPDLQVHGIDGLWVADASVLPTVPHANTNLAAILVGEIAAAHVAAATVAIT